ncbi:MAG: hypothetical protein KatS3mg053_0602 [Candidatus Roseilinea sp.]|nr:MAG: hypothetical protein KatS3mg053_0602 [Candidatus Roseilinea sp.]
MNTEMLQIFYARGDNKAMAQWTCQMKYMTACAMTAAALGLTMMLAPTNQSVAASAATSVDFAFELPAQAGAAKTFEFKVTTPGCIQAYIRPWTSSTGSGPKADKLQLALIGSDRDAPYVSITGSASNAVPLWVSYAAFPSDVNRVSAWKITVNTVTGRGSARGVVRVDYPPTQMPCALRATTNTFTDTRSVSLSWLFTDVRFDGAFLVERSSNNGAAWRMVRTCSLPITSRTLYVCTDANVSAGDYLYRVCTVSGDGTDAGCSASNVTPPVRVSLK